jgi:hypothetical protein
MSLAAQLPVSRHRSSGFAGAVRHPPVCYNFSITGDLMTTLLSMLHHERATLARKLAGVEAAISALNGTPKALKRRHTMSAAARARISAAQKKRWAKVKK